MANKWKKKYSKMRIKSKKLMKWQRLIAFRNENFKITDNKREKKKRQTYKKKKTVLMHVLHAEPI